MTIDGLPAAAAAPPLVSIVTIVRNNAARIERAMASVLSQTYRSVEYIVIDGGSTDGTVERVREHADRLSYWHSMPDGGISDAFNRGVALAHGEFVAIVNSDDWLSTGQIEAAVQSLSSSGAPFVFGDLLYHHADGGHAYKLRGDPDYGKRLWHGMPKVTHPTAVVRRDVYRDYGGFDPVFRIGMDYDWLQRLANSGVVGAHDPYICGHMSLGGVSDVRWRDCLDEHERIAIAHGGPAVLLHALFTWRRVRIFLRMALEKLVSPAVVVTVRQALNRSLEKSTGP